jgi:hypothetical protein
MRVFDTRDDMLRFLAKPGDRICEIGVFMGEFARVLASTQPSLLVLVDPWAGMCSSGDADGNNVQDVFLPNAYKSVLEWARPLPFVEVNRGYSTDILPIFDNNFFDIVYIDSAHDYHTTKRELELAWLKVKPGGFITFHDYEMNPSKAKHHYEFGVKQAVDEFCVAKGISLCAKGLDGCVSGALQR